MTLDEPAVVVSIEAGIGRVRLNRPKSMNVIDRQMAEALANAVRTVTTSPHCRVIVLCAEGRAFSGGGDLQAFHRDAAAAPQTASDIIGFLHNAVAMLAAASQLVIGSVHGAVAGAGLSLAVHCDFLIAAENARFVTAYSVIGASPDGGATWSLARLLGSRKATELLILSEPLVATEALQLGLVNRVVTIDQLAEETAAFAARIGAGPVGAYGRTKALLRHAHHRSLLSQLDEERSAFIEQSATAEFAEGVDAFVNKRPGRFRPI